jgi:hypothetical protein
MAGVVKSHLRRDGTPGRHKLHLAELLDFRPDQGTGKEFVVRLIHDQSPAASPP